MTLVLRAIVVHHLLLGTSTLIHHVGDRVTLVTVITGVHDGVATKGTWREGTRAVRIAQVIWVQAGSLMIGAFSSFLVLLLLLLLLMLRLKVQREDGGGRSHGGGSSCGGWQVLYTLLEVVVV